MPLTWIQMIPSGKCSFPDYIRKDPYSLETRKLLKQIHLHFLSCLLHLSLPGMLRNKRTFLFLLASSHSLSFSLCLLKIISAKFSNSLWPHGLEHTRPPCPSPAPIVYPNSCSLNWWCHPIISSSDIPFSSCPPSFPASGSYQMNQLFTSRGQSTGVSASASVLPMNTQDWFPLGWTLKSLLQHHSSKASILQCSAFFTVQLSHPYMTTGKTIALTGLTFVSKVMSLLFNMLSRFVIAFLPRS